LVVCGLVVGQVAALQPLVGRALLALPLPAEVVLVAVARLLDVPTVAPVPEVSVVTRLALVAPLAAPVDPDSLPAWPPLEPPAPVPAD
jgi:hypothetical protein